MHVCAQGRAVGKNGNTERDYMAVPTSLGPLWTMHDHILEEPPKHKRIGGGNVLEIYCCNISWPQDFKIGNSHFVLKKTFFKSQWENVHCTLCPAFPAGPSPLHQQYHCKCVLGGSGAGGGTQLTILGGDVGGKVGSGSWRPPWALLFWVATLRSWKKLGTPRNTGWGVHSFLAADLPAVAPSLAALQMCR